jgi:hypothetical protein
LRAERNGASAYPVIATFLDRRLRRFVADAPRNDGLL